MEQIPEKFLDDKGELNTSALIKSYCELEKKMSGMISLPKMTVMKMQNKNLIMQLVCLIMHLNIL